MPQVSEATALKNLGPLGNTAVVWLVPMPSKTAAPVVVPAGNPAVSYRIVTPAKAGSAGLLQDRLTVAAIRSAAAVRLPTAEIAVAEN